MDWTNPRQHTRGICAEGQNVNLKREENVQGMARPRKQLRCNEGWQTLNEGHPEGTSGRLARPYLLKAHYGVTVLGCEYCYLWNCLPPLEELSILEEQGTRPRPRPFVPLSSHEDTG
jgi:hypothetical protein